MEFGGPTFVVALVALSYGAWVINNWVRAKHGYALEDEFGGKTERADNAEASKLRAENAELRALLTKVEKRMQVLERIVTDKSYSVGAEIDALRDSRAADAATPLNVTEREKA